MATLKENITHIANMRKNWKRTDDDSVSDREYAFILNYYRAKLIRQDANTGRYITGNITQDLGLVEVALADAHECNTIKTCVIRTVNPIPKPIDTASRNLYTFIGPINGEKEWQRTTFNKVKYDLASPFTRYETRWYEKGDYIYIVNPPSNALKYINIQGVFEDPVKAREFHKCPGESCDCGCFEGFNFEYPLSITMLDTIVKMIYDAEIRFGAMMPPDTENNSKDDVAIVNKKK